MKQSRLWLRHVKGHSGHQWNDEADRLAAAGLEVYKGVNVVCKAFGEVVEHACHTPAIDPQELHAMQAGGENLVIVDGRTPEEFNRMSIPGGSSVPNAELVYRIADIAPDPDAWLAMDQSARTALVDIAHDGRFPDALHNAQANPSCTRRCTRSWKRRTRPTTRPRCALRWNASRARA